MLNGLILTMMIALPPLFTVVAVKIAYHVKNKNARKKDSEAKTLLVFKIYPEEGLAEQGLLWLSIATPLAYFITFGVFAWQGHEVNITALGFERFINISALPIGLLTFAVPLSLLVMRVHSTTQTATQIKITKHKNNLDGYYAHRKAMFEYFSAIEDTEYEGKIKGKFYLHPRLHIKFFKKTPPEKGIPNVNTHQIKKMLILLQRARVSLFTAMNQSTPYQDRAMHYMNASTYIYKLANLLALEEIYKELKERSNKVEVLLNDKSETPKTPRYLYTAGTEADEIFGAFRYCRSYARLICEFCGYSTLSFTQEHYSDVDKGDRFKSPQYYQLRHAVPERKDYTSLKIEKTPGLVL